MPTDTQKLKNDKDKIISSIKLRGPSLPVQIARSINVPPLFASAFLSELYAEKKILMSNMKVGSSPLYYLSGQEPLLENFTQYLGHREREAFELIKKEKILEDDKLSPVMRVALRSLKDFAYPVRVRINEEIKIFWRYFLINESEVSSLIQKKLSPSTVENTTQQTPDISKEIEIPQKEEAPKKEEIFDPPKQTEIKPFEKTPFQQKPVPQETVQTHEEKKKPQRNKNYKFPESIRSYLSNKNIEFVETIDEKAKDFVAKIKIDTQFGKQTFLLLAKDKKKISEDDLALALQKAREYRIPAFFLTNGDLNPKAQEYLSKWEGLLKFKKAEI